MKTIPGFPCFVGVNLDIRQEIVDFTRGFRAYSDFNFVNLHSWNNNGDMAVAWLNGNLVFKFRDYMSDEIFYSFIGRSHTVETAKVLLREAARDGHEVRLRLIPEDCALGLFESDEFIISEDENNHDYLLSISTLAAIKGGQQAHTREQVNRFVREHGEAASFYEIDLLNAIEQHQLCAVFEAREEVKDSNDEENERQAFRRLLDHVAEFNLKAYGVKIDGNLKAFIICEIDELLPVVAHFWKADTRHRGIYHFLLHNLSKELERDGHELLNFEQDLGIPGLRAAKQYLRPVAFFKKYTVELADDLDSLETESPEDMQIIGFREISPEYAGTVD